MGESLISGRADRTDTLLAFVDRSLLQHVQDSLTAALDMSVQFVDGSGRTLTEPTDALRRAASDTLLGQLLTGETDEEDGVFRAPVQVEGQKLAILELLREDPAGNPVDPRRLAVGIELIHLIADSLTRLCEQEVASRHRVEELAVLYRVSSILSAQRDLRKVLDQAAHAVGEVMNARAVSIRLLDEEHGTLETRASYRLSADYLEKGALDVESSPIFTTAMAGEPVYVSDMGRDPRVLYPEEARAEGIVSMLCVGMAYQGRAIGTVQVFAGTKRRFTEFESDLVVALAQLLAAAIENARLDEERREKDKLVNQLNLAASVQRRMLPKGKPSDRRLDVAARYIPSLELAGDFYDFIRLERHLGVVIGDVVGKGVAASLLMASVRASLRAFAQDLYDIDEIMSRVNRALTRDTLDSEFATLFYGVIDPDTLRMTYCNAGHEPPILRRRAKLYQLNAGGLVVGVDRDAAYEKGLWDLETDDVLVLTTDGVTEATSFDGEQFGRERLNAAVLAAEGNADQIMNHLLWEVRRFTGIRRASDDTTIVVIRVTDG
ncbi:PP2C family protein-serine/threonine phosphatase [Mucisphaera calidilacus]|nr:GAF domain-containing SpoIIE family protein phosphatase [Mucisphaera calidilacus]